MPTFDPHRLEAFAAQLFGAAGMERAKAETVGRLLVLTDMLGRRTHGLAMAPSYLSEIEKVGMRATGEPEVVRDTGATVVWDGDYLQELCLVDRALAKQAADKGYVALIANSDPSGRRVAPYGGTEALFTPNPFAIGYPGADHPVLIDISASITTTSMTRQKLAAGEQFEHPWLLDAQGVPTRDPAVLEQREPRGSLQLIGGQEYGHKGFGFALMIEALSQGLSGHGRRDAPKRWGGNVFLQVLDPEFFAGREAFADQMNHLSDRCRANKPVRADRPVRMPGDQAA